MPISYIWCAETVDQSGALTRIDFKKFSEAKKYKFAYGPTTVVLMREEIRDGEIVHQSFAETTDDYAAERWFYERGTGRQVAPVPDALHVELLIHNPNAVVTHEVKVGDILQTSFNKRLGRSATVQVKAIERGRVKAVETENSKSPGKKWSFKPGDQLAYLEPKGDGTTTQVWGYLNKSMKLVDYPY